MTKDIFRPFCFLMALTLGLYFLRVTLLPVFGEESRRGVIAREMLETDDWIVPRVQGIPRLSRPPLQNWLIAVASGLTGHVDLWAIRLPSLICTLATVALVYWYSVRRSGLAVAVLATTAYLTMYEVLEYGRLGETEAVFTWFVASSLLLWHLGDGERWNRWVLWPVCYLMVAGGMLTKGMQAPLYFVGAVSLTLIFQRRARELISLPHFCGIGVFLACFGGWQLAFISRMGWHDGFLIHWLNIAYRFTDKTNHSFLAHFIQFPFETFAVMLPGSLLLLPAISSAVRARCRVHTETIHFLAIAVGWAFVFVWLPPGSRARYFMPLMPLCAVLMGLVGHAWMSVPWRNWSPTARQRIFLATSAALAMLYAGPILTIQAGLCDDTAQQIADLKTKLPADARLVSLDQLHHAFLYYYSDPIRLVPLPSAASDMPDDFEYFALHTHESGPPPLPFAWETVQVITCDRYRRAVPRVKTYIGRRLEPRLAMNAE